MITRLDIYTDGVNGPRDSILFTDASKAQDAVFNLMSDDGLQGITDIKLVSVLTDEEGINAFYQRSVDEEL